ncbi:MAG: hypothetical protein JXQ96_20135 [Cyclobacteriaceae bacterium]
MINSLNKRNAMLATCLLAAFAGLFICAFSCDFDIYSFNRQIGTNEAAEHHQSNDSDHHHDHNHHHHSSQNNHADHSTDHHEKNNGDNPDECCDDLRQSVFETLIKNDIQKQILSGNFIVLYITSIPDYNFGLTKRLDKNHILRCNLPPPIRGFDIRILIQSFLN